MNAQEIMVRPFNYGDLVVRRYGEKKGDTHVAIVSDIISSKTLEIDYISCNGDMVMDCEIEQNEIVCIRTPRKGVEQARDIVAMLGKQARIAKNLQASELGWKFLKEFYRNGGIKNYGVVIFESAKSMLK